MTDHPPLKAYPSIQGRCPACRGDSLFIGSGGYVTCSRLDCPNPSAADQLLHGESTDIPVDIPADKNGPTIVNAQADGGEVADNEADTETADFDRDPAALAWARTKIQHYIDRLADFEQQVAARGDEASVRCFRVVQGHVRSYFLGDGGCVIGAFDERRPAHLDAIDAASGPTVREAAADDRRWPLQKEGE